MILKKVNKSMKLLSDRFTSPTIYWTQNQIC